MGRKADAAVISDDLARSIYEHNEFVKRHCK